MPAHPAHRLIQLGLRSLGFDTGPLDGWWGRKTGEAVAALLTEGPVTQSPWAVETLRRGLGDLGYSAGTGAIGWGGLRAFAAGSQLFSDLHKVEVGSGRPSPTRCERRKGAPLAQNLGRS